MAISHCYWHLVVKNGNWQIYPEICSQIYPPKCIMGYILWDVFHSHFVFSKKRWKFPCYFWIIRVVNSQLALYSHVRCNPLHTPSTPPKHPQMTITNFNYEVSYLPGLVCNIVVKADLGRSAGRSIPPVLTSCGQD